MTGWQPIKTAPKAKTRILAVKGKQVKIVVYYPNLKEWGNPQEWGDDGTWMPTHWMPLPSAPNASLGPSAADEIERLRAALDKARRAMQATISKFDACDIIAVRNTHLGINGLRAALLKGENDV
jgi:hypothetical protein